MNCQFCHSVDDVQQKPKFTACRACLTLQKRMKRDTGLFYDVMGRRYMTGADIRTEFSKDKRLLVLDLHGVTDLLSKAEFADMVTRVEAAGFRVILLSYVGTTTQTRIDAQTDMLAYMAHAANVCAFTCFHRGDTVELSNKGHFVQMLMDPETTVHFFDDGLDHVMAVGSVGSVGSIDTGSVTAHHVQTNDSSCLLHEIYQLA